LSHGAHAVFPFRRPLTDLGYHTNTPLMQLQLTRSVRLTQLPVANPAIGFDTTNCPRHSFVLRGLVLGIHVQKAVPHQRRGCPGQARP
jgi:hypothetical protein